MNPVLLSRVVRFFGIGGVSTAIYWATLLALTSLLHVDPTAASVGAYIAGFIVAYWGHRNITYRSRAFVGQELARFLAVHALCFCGGNLIFWVANTNWHLPVMASGLLLTAVNVGMALLAYEFWVFRPKPNG